MVNRRCKACNDEMACTFEEPMSALIRAGDDAIQDHMVEHGGLLPFTWMAPIFLKLNLKDRRLKRHLDRRLNDDPISADYTWEHMHHLHTVARAFHINATVEGKAVGSLVVFPIDAEPTVAACMAHGPVGGEAFAFDASMVRADANRKNGHDNDDRPPTAGTPAARDYLATLDDAAFGAATPVVPKVISPVDPAARWTSAHGAVRNLRTAPTI